METGTLSVPLQTTDADGNLYGLSGTFTLSEGPETIVETVSPTDAQTSLLLDPRVGNYVLELTEWTIYSLEDPTAPLAIDGVTLLSPSQVSVQILNRQTTSANFSFAVPGRGPVHFARGTLEISYDVEGGYPEGAACLEDVVCASRVCLNGACAAPTCTDGVLNGDETGADCGGTCPQSCLCAADSECAAGETCVNGACAVSCTTDAECASGPCVNGVCSSAPNGILVLQNSFNFGPSHVSIVSRDTGTVVATSPVGNDPMAVVPDPDGVSFWVSTPNGLERHSNLDATLIGQIPLSGARDMEVIPGQSRLVVAGYEQVFVVDLPTQSVVAIIPLLPGDQTVGLSVSPDGSQAVVGAFDGSNSRLVFISTNTYSVVQDMPVSGYPFDNLHLGDRVLTWDDNDEELRFYTGSPWTEDVTRRVTLPSDAAASMNGFHNMRYNPADGRVYVFQSMTPQVLAFDSVAPPIFSTYPVGTAYMGFVLDADGAGLLGLRYPPNSAGFEHMDLPSGALSSPGIDTSGLPTSDGIVDLRDVYLP